MSSAARVCVRACSCLDVYQHVGVGGRLRWRRREGDDADGRKGREDSVLRGERASWEEGGGKGSRKGRDREDALTAYRCWSLRQRSAALSGHRKMVSVRGELTVAYNLMFSILDSFSMGNATARNSRAQLPLLLSALFILRLSCSLQDSMLSS